MRLMFKMEFVGLGDAGRMEIRLKKLKSRKIIERIIRDQDIKLGL